MNLNESMNGYESMEIGNRPELEEETEEVIGYWHAPRQHQEETTSETEPKKGSFLEILCHSLDILSSAASPVALALSWCFCSCSTFIDLRRISGPIRAEFVRFDVEASKF